MHEMNIILTLTGGLIAGLVFGYISNRLKLSPIVGYLIAGVAIGPFTPGFTADPEIAYQFAEVGVMLLMFGVGLHFHVEDLLAVRRIAIPGAVGQIAVATALGAFVSHLFGWSWQAGVVYGICLSVASTVVLTRVLVDNRELHTATGHAAVGWLIVEDLFTVMVLVLLPIILGGQGSGADLIGSLGLVLLKVLLLVIAVFTLGTRAIPWLFAKVAQSGSRELFTLTVLATALGIAVASAKLFDVSMALGAFLAGMVVGKSEFSVRAASDALPLKDAFSALFFVSVGMLLDPSIFLEHPGLIAATMAVVVVGKSIAAFGIVLLLGYPLKIALGVSVALAQIGEFSFILASLSKQLGLLSELALHTLVATAILSITLNPILFRLIPGVEAWIGARPRLNQLLNWRLQRRLSRDEAPPALVPDPLAPHAIIVGYGPVGSIVTRLLKDNGVPCVIIELNLETARRLIAEGKNVVYGDVRHVATLEQARIHEAKTFVISSSGIQNPKELVRTVTQINPGIQIIARTIYASEMDALRQAGCTWVFSGEGEAALALAEEVLRELGATDEQIERERLRVRQEIGMGERAT